MVNRTKPLRVRKKKKNILVRPTPKSEITRLGGALRSLGGLGGGALGSLIGMPGAGANFGNSLGASLSKWLGSGDYTIDRNSLVSGFKSSGSIPMMHNTNQSVVIRHKEYLGDIQGSMAFALGAPYPLNPGSARTFPWLSTVAQNFQEYTIRGLIFHYIPTSGDSVSGTNPALGSVMMSTSYRSTAPAPTNKIFMLNEYCSSDARPSEAFAHPIECDPKENPYNVQYVRNFPVPAGEDAKTYDMGYSIIGTQGQPADNNIIGELWCSYEVELRKPIALGLTAVDSARGNASRTGAASITAPFGTTALLTNGDAMFSITATKITFRSGMVGTFELLLRYDGAGPNAWDFQTLTCAGCTLLNAYQPKVSTVTGGAGFLVYIFYLAIPDSNVQASVTNTSSFVSAGLNGNVLIDFYQISPTI